ncbi:hypothetical protein CDAR_268481 [Caerostris darwini]|uniref:Uncharacterized protein n=1 Tax=Caerostris darwini TaxID=1538125 RepID=A0AAV4W520_9ARAC|nr:hypothetical protein CDAR_268481 [Caerostris darwini]
MDPSLPEHHADAVISKMRKEDTKIQGKPLKLLKQFDCTSKEEEELIKFKNPPIKGEATAKKEEEPLKIKGHSKIKEVKFKSPTCSSKWPSMETHFSRSTTQT